MTKRVYGIGGVILIALVVGGIVLATSKHGVQKLAEPALNTSSQNTARTNDVAMVVATISEFAANHNGALPVMTAAGPAGGELEICGADCSIANKSVVQLTHYLPQSVREVPYLSDLAVPDADKVIIVPDASCKADHSGIGPFTKASAHSVAVLYALSTGSGLKQQCLTQ
jgi:hypothetical protein